MHRFCSLLSSACVARATAENVAAVLEQVYRETGLSGVSASRFPSQTSHDGSTVRKPTHAEQPGLTEDEGAAESSPPDSLPTLTHGSVAVRSIKSCSAQQPQGSSSVLPPVVPVRDTPSSHAVRAAGMQHSASAPEVSRDDAARLVGGAQRRGVDLYDYFVDGADVVMPDDSADSQPVDSPAIQVCSPDNSSGGKCATNVTSRSTELPPRRWPHSECHACSPRLRLAVQRSTCVVP